MVGDFLAAHFTALVLWKNASQSSLVFGGGTFFILASSNMRDVQSRSAAQACCASLILVTSSFSCVAPHQGFTAPSEIAARGLVSALLPTSLPGSCRPQESLVGLAARQELKRRKLSACLHCSHLLSTVSLCVQPPDCGGLLPAALHCLQLRAHLLPSVSGHLHAPLLLALASLPAAMAPKLLSTLCLRIAPLTPILSAEMVDHPCGLHLCCRGVSSLPLSCLSRLGFLSGTPPLP